MKFCPVAQVAEAHVWRRPVLGLCRIGISQAVVADDADAQRESGPSFGDDGMAGC